MIKRGIRKRGSGNRFGGNIGGVTPKGIEKEGGAKGIMGGIGGEVISTIEGARIT